MFTGLIEAVGTVANVESTATERRLRIATTLAPELSSGDSLAINGVCLTVVVTGTGVVHVDVGPETAQVTTLGSVKADQRVNLERSMRADGRMGGHFVQGHVDGMGIVSDMRRDGDSHWLTVSFDRGLAAYLIPKGSIAVDGVSLTVAHLRHNEFDVMIIPFTWDHTTLSTLTPGDRVNLECDMIGKYVARTLELSGANRLV